MKIKLVLSCVIADDTLRSISGAQDTIDDVFKNTVVAIKMAGEFHVQVMSNKQDLEGGRSVEEHKLNEKFIQMLKEAHKELISFAEVANNMLRKA